MGGWVSGSTLCVGDVVFFSFSVDSICGSAVLFICLDGGPQKDLDLATFTISEVVCQFLELRIKIKYKKVLSLNLSICD